MSSSSIPDYRNLLVTIEEDIAVLTINRPRYRNALTLEAKQEMLDFFRFADQTEQFKAVILTGAGDIAFCAGTDVKEMSGLGPLDGERMLWVEHRMNEAIRRCSKPVIAAVNGHAIGGGLLTAILCDYSVVAETALLSFPEIKAGLPASIEIAVLPRLIGFTRAKELIFFGERIAPDEAQRCGLINRVVPQAEVMYASREAARKMLAHDGLVIRLQKDLIAKWLETDFTAATETAIYAAGLAFAAGVPKAVWTDKRKDAENGGKEA